jgi:hypothetical protein
VSPAHSCTLRRVWPDHGQSCSGHDAFDYSGFADPLGRVIPKPEARPSLVVIGMGSRTIRMELGSSNARGKRSAALFRYFQPESVGVVSRIASGGHGFSRAASTLIIKIGIVSARQGILICGKTRKTLNRPFARSQPTRCHLLLKPITRTLTPPESRATRKLSADTYGFDRRGHRNVSSVPYSASVMLAKP